MTERDLLAAGSIAARAADPARFVAAVIITYNCQVGRVIIVDNGSEPETLNAIRSAIPCIYTPATASF
jgi:hypothetical protein